MTILPRSNGAGGFTLFAPSEERLESGLYSRRYLQGQLAVALGGRVAEEIAFGEGEVTVGAASDLQTVRSLARRMVAQWGFGSADGLGATPVAWEGPEGNSLLSRGASEATEAAIDLEVSSLVTRAYRTARATLLRHRPLLDAVTAALLEEETIDRHRIADLYEQHTGIRPTAEDGVSTVQDDDWGI